MQITQLRNATVLLEFTSPEGRPVGLLVDPMLAPRAACPRCATWAQGASATPSWNCPGAQTRCCSA